MDKTTEKMIVKMKMRLTKNAETIEKLQKQVETLQGFVVQSNSIIIGLLDRCTGEKRQKALNAALNADLTFLHLEGYEKFARKLSYDKFLVME